MHAHISDTAHVGRTRPERTTPKIFLSLREALKHEASGGTFQGVSPSREGETLGGATRERDAHALPVH